MEISFTKRSASTYLQLSRDTPPSLHDVYSPSFIATSNCTTTKYFSTRGMCPNLSLSAVIRSKRWLRSRGPSATANQFHTNTPSRATDSHRTMNLLVMLSRCSRSMASIIHWVWVVLTASRVEWSTPRNRERTLSYPLVFIQGAVTWSLRHGRSARSPKTPGRCELTWHAYRRRYIRTE